MIEFALVVRGGSLIIGEVTFTGRKCGRGFGLGGCCSVVVVVVVVVVVLSKSPVIGRCSRA